ncbi:hypothetical protein [Ruficoccus sp. ZRK36]|uniref:hypothetical protein n=1 Tax=Ruficoccus sp. ZRK36 TaxID=2866311 RepID=UPI001C731C10|nr:hypothetical protein [Ruficoccus sp. ZRK36]QYY36003.1 hypothetical protein K0V07_00680 [Ruficoccus sp. ZRK36]
MEEVHTASKSQRPWPLLPTLWVYLGGTLLYNVLVYALDGRNEPRMVLFLGLSLLYWGRFALASALHEKKSPYKLYWTVMLLSGPIEIVAEMLLLR